MFLDKSEVHRMTLSIPSQKTHLYIAHVARTAWKFHPFLSKCKRMYTLRQEELIEYYRVLREKVSYARRQCVFFLEN